MATLYTQAESNVRKTWFYLAFFLVLVVLVGWLISYLIGSQIILYIAVAYSIFISFLSYWYSDKIVLSISRAKPIEKKDNPELYRIVENLCITAGLPVPKIYIIEESQPNAFATGRNPKHGVIVFTRGILEKLERSELEGVAAHELSHIGNRDALLQTIVVVLTGIVVMMVDMFIRITFWGGGLRRDDRNSQMRAFMMVIGLILLILAPFVAQLIKFAISRKREFLADAAGALLTRYPEGLARALEKISSDSSPLRSANNATSHLYICSPLKGKASKSWFSKLFMTHPPVEERIKALRGMRL